MALTKAAKVLKSGGVIAFPTETVYGIGALLNNRRGIRKIYRLKKRPRNKPLQVLASSLAEAKKMATFSPQALALAKKFWPGPLTLVLPALKGKKTIGLRVPSHRRVLELIRKCGPLAATSANISSERPFLTAREVKNGLPGLDYVLSGRVKLGRPSKVIDVTTGLRVLRP